MPNWNGLAVCPQGAVVSLDYVAGPSSWLPNGRPFPWLEKLVNLIDPADPLFDAILEGELFTGLAFGPDGRLHLATEGAYNQILTIDPAGSLVRRLWAPNRDHRSAPAEALTDEHAAVLEHPPGVLATTANGELYVTVFRSPRRLGEHAFVFDYWPSIWRVTGEGSWTQVAGTPEAPLQVGMDWREAGLGLIRSICPRPDGGFLLHVTRPVDAGSPAAARDAGASGLAETRAGDLPSYEHVVHVDGTGRITAIWGTGVAGLDVSGTAVATASLEGLKAIALGPDGTVYLMLNSRSFAGILAVGANGIARLLETFDFPHSIAPVMTPDGDGNLYWLETPVLMRRSGERTRTFAPGPTFFGKEG